MAYITRIAFNSANWQHPTGEAASHEQEGTYNNVNHFGHEDWLFRNDWQIDGWRYAFIQGIGRSRSKLLAQRDAFNVTLFTIQPDKQRRYVANIADAECLDDTQASEALVRFRELGWLTLMEQEIRAIGGNPDALGDARWAKDVLNVRFRVESVQMYPVDTFAKKDDPVLRLPRYTLTDLARSSVQPPPINGRQGTTQPPNTNSHIRKGTGPTEVSPEHARMQLILMQELRLEYPGAYIAREENFIDVLVETSDDLRLYEIKSDLSPRSVLRQAIGQLLEYAYFSDWSQRTQLGFDCRRAQSVD